MASQFRSLITTLISHGLELQLPEGVFQLMDPGLLPSQVLRPEHHRQQQLQQLELDIRVALQQLVSLQSPISQHFLR
jgi:hypothetical protein